jgi:hypothetical protein
MSDQPLVPQTAKVPLIAHALCGWPLLLVFVGGAIGGAVGGLAYGINIAIYRSRLSLIEKLAFNIVVGSAAFIAWTVMAGLIHRQLT